MTSDAPGSTLIALLEQEKAALLLGDIDRIDGISQEKALWVSENPSDKIELTEEQAKRIKSLSSQNHQLFETLLDAQKAIIERFEEIQRAQTTIGAYSKDGLFKANPDTELELRS